MGHLFLQELGTNFIAAPALSLSGIVRHGLREADMTGTLFLDSSKEDEHRVGFRNDVCL